MTTQPEVALKCQEKDGCVNEDLSACFKDGQTKDDDTIASDHSVLLVSNLIVLPTRVITTDPCVGATLEVSDTLYEFCD